MEREESKLKIEYLAIDELIPAEYNPRRISEQDRMEITASLRKYGFVDPVIVNRNPQRYNVIVGGHQRVTIAKSELGHIEVPCIFVNLTIEDEKELNMRLNKNTGRWDFDKLQQFFTVDWLKGVGWKDSELGFFQTEFEKKFKSITNANCDMPIVPKFSEKYDAVIIISRNSIDTTYLETVLNIQKEQSYKNTRTGKAMVIDVEHLRKALGGKK